MPSGRVKVFHEDRKYGFVIDDEAGKDYYVHADDTPGGALNSGDLVEFELNEEDEKPRARAVKVTKAAGPGQPIGQVLVEPPSYEELEERERARRAARRRRR